MTDLEGLELEVKIMDEERESSQEGIKIDLSVPNALSALALLGVLVNRSNQSDEDLS